MECRERILVISNGDKLEWRRNSREEEFKKNIKE
jgi:hypothetical protein